MIRSTLRLRRLRKSYRIGLAGRGHAPGFADIIIAATARQHTLTIPSRNVRHFELLGVPVLDLFGELPPT
ncbi:MULTISPECIES: hypothetical protein [Bradyrhizobium]|uniref:hypothetical protein n=1 Tax=Bradyrhizobium TaxID=374 RepID=UPI00293E8DFC|nr:hypothetical protein [Bradyrhizobium sp. NDS-1]WOH71037.1 hypothetical protein RX330_22410 [Bradyrhizobium sp. NDS-1]